MKVLAEVLLVVVGGALIILGSLSNLLSMIIGFRRRHIFMGIAWACVPFVGMFLANRHIPRDGSIHVSDEYRRMRSLWTGGDPSGRTPLYSGGYFYKGRSRLIYRYRPPILPGLVTLGSHGTFQQFELWKTQHGTYVYYASEEGCYQEIRGDESLPDAKRIETARQLAFHGLVSIGSYDSTEAARREFPDLYRHWEGHER